MKKGLSFLNKSFGLSVQVALGRMDGKNIKRIDYDTKADMEGRNQNFNN